MPIIRDSHEETDSRAIGKAVNNFNALRCECVVTGDKDKMLNIITVAFGDIYHFNQALRQILRRGPFNSDSFGAISSSELSASADDDDEDPSSDFEFRSESAGSYSSE